MLHPTLFRLAVVQDSVVDRVAHRLVDRDPPKVVDKLVDRVHQSPLQAHHHQTRHLQAQLLPTLDKTPMTQTPTTFSAREALTQLRAAPTLSQASTPQGCPLQGLATQALGPQALKTLAFAPQALLTWALTPQGEMDLELGHQAHQDQLGLTATSPPMTPTSMPSLASLLHPTVRMLPGDLLDPMILPGDHLDQRIPLFKVTLQGLGGRTLGCRATSGGQQGSKALKAAQAREVHQDTTEAMYQ